MNNQRRPNCFTATTHPRYLMAAGNNYAFAVAPSAPAVLGATENGNDHQCQYHQMMVVSEEQGKRILDAWTTKLARTKRKMARQLRANLKHSTRNINTVPHSNPSTSSSSSSCSSNNTISPRSHMTREDQEVVVMPNNINNSAGIQTGKETDLVPDLYNFFTPVNKRLRMVLKKELKKSDVGSLGRIVLPKREAENKLPILTDKEGVQLMIKDIYSNTQWALRYKYWLNNKSRMYVLENTGDFVKQNELEMGDSITIYEDEFKNLYVAMKKGDKVRPSLSEASCKYDVVNSTNKAARDDNLYSYAFASKDNEDMESLELFLKEPQSEACNSFVTSFSRDNSASANSCAGQWEDQEVKCTASMSQYYMNDVITEDGTNYVTPQQPPLPACSNVMKGVDDHFFDDCYGDLGILPEVNRYKYYDYLTLFDPIMSEKS